MPPTADQLVVDPRAGKSLFAASHLPAFGSLRLHLVTRTLFLPELSVDVFQCLLTSASNKTSICCCGKVCLHACTWRPGRSCAVELVVDFFRSTSNESIQTSISFAGLLAYLHLEQTCFLQEDEIRHAWAVRPQRRLASLANLFL